MASSIEGEVKAVVVTMRDRKNNDHPQVTSQFTPLLSYEKRIHYETGELDVIKRQ